GYRVYRTPFEPGAERAFGLPLGEVVGSNVPSFEDRLNLDAVRYYYTVVPLDDKAAELPGEAQLGVNPLRAVTAVDGVDRGLAADVKALSVGTAVQLPLHPFGTDYLGRDLLARLIFGARVSLFIGIVAPLIYVLSGILYGSTAGFVGGRVDQVLM